MKEKVNFSSVLGPSVAIGVIFGFAFNFLIEAICPAPISVLDPTDEYASAFALGGCAAVLCFILLIATNALGKPDKLEKLACLVALGWAIVWFAHTFFVGDICWSSNARSAVLYLFTPIALIALAILGRRWIADESE